MTTTNGTTVDEAKAAAREAASQPFDKFLERLGEKVGAQATVRAVFGEPIERQDLTVVPVARVRWGFGGGAGTGTAVGGPAAMADLSGDTAAVPSGSGGGGGVVADPLGYLEIRSTGAVFQPLSPVNVNPMLVLAAGISAAVVIRAIARLLRG
jgi:uncharacterized spore protein YtfJ